MIDKGQWCFVARITFGRRPRLLPLLLLAAAGLWLASARGPAAYADEAPPPTGAASLPETISAGGYHTCGLKADGTVVCWGLNADSQATTPAHDPGDYLQVSAGWQHSCGLQADGMVVCWGYDGNGRSSPPAHDPGDYVQVSAGNMHTCGLQADGTVECWGSDSFGQATPPAHGPGDYVQVSAGNMHTCGLQADGTVECWGSDSFGQATPPAHNPGDYLQVSTNRDHTCGLKADGTIACWGNNSYGQVMPPAHDPGDYVQVSAGGYHTCGLQADGTVVCWGRNDNDQATPPAHEAGDYRQVNAGGSQTCGLRADGTVECWGNNAFGQASPPAHVIGDYGRQQVSAGGPHTCGLEAWGTIACWGGNTEGQRTPPAHDPGDFVRVSAGYVHTCGLQADRTVACWGNDAFGQSTPPAHDPGDFLQVSPGGYHTCGLKADGTVTCWGQDSHGQATPPTHAAGDYLQVSAGTYHTCGLEADGTVECWGSDSFGQSTPPAHSPGDFLQVSAGTYHTCGLRADGTVKCWGNDSFGQSTPPAHGPGDFLQVSAGGYGHTCGLEAGGTVVCWGWNVVRQSLPPAHTLGDYRQLSAGQSHTCGLKADGTLTCWGDNIDGQAPVLHPKPASLPGGTAGEGYQQALTTVGGKAPHHFALVGGSLPPGLALEASGLLGGTPTAGGEYTFRLQVRDASALPFSAEREYVLSISMERVYADPAGLCGGNSPCFASLQTAVASLQADGTVEAAPGPYVETVVVSRSLTLAGPLALNGALVVGQDLLAYWPFDEGLGVLAFDASSGGHNGALKGGVTWTADVPPLSFADPKALNLDGLNDYVSIADCPELNFDDKPSFSLVVWVKNARISGHMSDTALMAKGSGDEVQYLLDLYDGYPRFRVRSDAGVVTSIQAAADRLDSDHGWAHVAAVLDAAQGLMKLYVDGAEAASGTPPAALLANDHEVTIGYREGTPYFQGKIDDVRIYGRALSAAEVTALAAGRHNHTLTLGSDLDLNGDLALHGTALDAEADRTLRLAGNWTSYGGAFDARGGLVAFDGGAAQVLQGDVAFHDLAVGSGTTLQTASRPTVGGTLDNQGWTEETRAIDGNGAQFFGLADVVVDVTTRGSLAGLVVARRDEDHPEAGAEVRTGRYWRLTPDGSGYSVDLTLPHGLIVPSVCRHEGGGAWGCAAGSHDATTVTRSGITQLSDWAVGQYWLYLPLLIK